MFRPAVLNSCSWLLCIESPGHKHDIAMKLESSFLLMIQYYISQHPNRQAVVIYIFIGCPIQWALAILNRCQSRTTIFVSVKIVALSDWWLMINCCWHCGQMTWQITRCPHVYMYLHVSHDVWDVTGNGVQQWCVWYWQLGALKNWIWRRWWPSCCFTVPPRSTNIHFVMFTGVHRTAFAALPAFSTFTC